MYLFWTIYLLNVSWSISCCSHVVKQSLILNVIITLCLVNFLAFFNELYHFGAKCVFYRINNKVLYLSSNTNCMKCFDHDGYVVEQSLIFTQQTKVNIFSMDFIFWNLILFLSGFWLLLDNKCFLFLPSLFTYIGILYMALFLINYILFMWDISISVIFISLLNNKYLNQYMERN
jgi:hypothetical protein